jgi:hypothetical protein
MTPNGKIGEQSRQAGRVSACTLERWALVRQIAELEEALADSYHIADVDSAFGWVAEAQALLAEKRAALRQL